MLTPTFSDGQDRTTFAPFVLRDCRDTDYPNVNLQFSDHDWRNQHIGDDHIGDYYLNGYGIQGLVIAARQLAGLEPIADGMEPDSEGDTCLIYFTDLDMAIETARLAHAMIHDPAQRSACAQLAADEGYDDV